LLSTNFHVVAVLLSQALAQDKQLAANLWKASCAAVGWSDGRVKP
jgi:hypothetical protein